MSRYAIARWDPAGTPGGPITPRVAILHSEATKGGLARPSGGPLEWHFIVRYDGTVIQHVDTNRRADANRDANGFAISIETEDNGDPDHEPWTEQQLVAIVDLLAWICDTHDIPRTRCDRWDGRGIGFHTMWGAPSKWTPVVKTCPGAARKAQFPLILERLQAAKAAGVEPAPPTVEEDPDMPDARPMLAHKAGDPAIFVVDGIHKRWVQTEDERKLLIDTGLVRVNPDTGREFQVPDAIIDEPELVGPAPGQ